MQRPKVSVFRISDRINEVARKISSNKYSLQFSAPAASAADLQKIRNAIKNATSLHDVERLTRILQSGQIPEELLGADENGHSEMDES